MEYYIIIAASIAIILSYIFNWISEKTNFPSVLLLIILGVVFKQLLNIFHAGPDRIQDLFGEIRLLEVLGTVGLILIVLEAALDLKIEKGKIKFIGRTFFIAIVLLLATAGAIGYIISVAIPEISFLHAMIYATPLSIISSAIVIPSVVNLGETQEEFHIYESTFSDILGIMLFYFLTGLAASSSGINAVGDFSLNLILTIGISVVLSYLMLFIFQKLKAEVKLFLMISVLLLLFSVGKLMHMSSLIVILIFGLILSNHKTLIPNKLTKYVDYNAVKGIYDTFLLITRESAFVIRTFFFVIFGFTVVLSSLFSMTVAIVSGLILITIYLLRGLLLKVVIHHDVLLPTYIAPRGLITLLLYFSIPDEVKTEAFNDGILLFVIIISSLLMTFGLIKYGNKPEESEKMEEIKETAEE